MTQRVKGVVTRDMLARYFNDDPRLLRAFADQSEVVQETSANTVAASTALQDASFITLSPNEALTSERVLTEGAGISLTITDGAVTISLSEGAAIVSGGFQTTFYVTGLTNIQLPQTGTMATLAGGEVLSNKTLQTPRLTGLGNYADDTAAASGGVPVGGMYRDGSVLMVRVS